MTWMITWILFAAVLSACGKEADDKKLIPKPEKKQEADAETETKTEANAEGRQKQQQKQQRTYPRMGIGMIFAETGHLLVLSIAIL